MSSQDVSSSDFRFPSYRTCENLVRGPQPNVKCFFEQRHATQFRVRKVNTSKWSCSLATRWAPNESGSGTNHRVAPAHHVETFAQIPDVADVRE